MDSIQIGTTVIRNGQTINKSQLNGQINSNWSIDPNSKHTILVYDINTKRPRVHYLIVNVSGTYLGLGSVIFPWEEPNPPEGETHSYFVDIFSQNSRIVPPIVNDREDFDIVNFIQMNNLTQIGRINFYVESSVQSPRSKGMHPPNEQQRKFCHCVLEVEQKGKTRNPYAICAKSTGTSYHWCSEQVYDFQNMDLRSLQAYSALHNIPTCGTKDDLLNRISEFKQKEVRT